MTKAPSSLVTCHSSLVLRFSYLFSIGDAHRHWPISNITRWAPGRAVEAMFATCRSILGLFPKTSKDHLSRSCLKHTGHRDIGILANKPARVIDHHHSAVIEIGNALIVF